MIERFAKYEKKKVVVDEKEITFKPQLSKKTEEIYSKKAQKRNAFEELTQDSKMRQQKEKENR